MSSVPPSIPPSSPPPPGGGAYPPPPGGYTPPPGGASSDRTLMLVLSYIGLLALIPLLVKKEDREVQWHAKNGLAIFVAYIIVIILWNIVTYFLPTTIGCVLSFVGCALWIGYLVIIILGIMKALKGERFIVPGISDFADKM
jgi:uncharacterized membrane protein